MLKDSLNIQKAEQNVDGDVGYTSQCPGSGPQGRYPPRGQQEMPPRSYPWVTSARRETRVHRKGNGRIGRHPDCREEEVICRRFTAACGQRSSPRERRRAGEGSGCCSSIMRCRVLQPHRALCRGRFIKLELVINANFLSLFSLWLSFIIEIKDMR